MGYLLPSSGRRVEKSVYLELNEIVCVCHCAIPPTLLMSHKIHPSGVSHKLDDPSDFVVSHKRFVTN